MDYALTLSRPVPILVPDLPALAPHYLQRVDYALTLAVEMPASDVSPTELLVHMHNQQGDASPPPNGPCAGESRRLHLHPAP